MPLIQSIDANHQNSSDHQPPDNLTSAVSLIGIGHRLILQFPMVVPIILGHLEESVGGARKKLFELRRLFRWG